MIRALCTTGSLALLLTITACQSAPIKEKTAANTEQKIIRMPAESLDSFNARIQADSLFIMGDVYSREGQAEKAIELFEQVAVLDPVSPFVHTRLAAEYLKLKNNYAAILNADLASQKDPKNVDALMFLAGLNAAEKNYDKAIEQYNEVLRMAPALTEAALYIGSLYTEQQNYPKAEQTFNAILKNPKAANVHMVHYYLGLMHAEQKGTKHQVAAESAFKKSLNAKPDFADSLTSLAHLYMQQGKQSKALSVCEDFQKRQGFNQHVADLIAQMHVENGDPEKALSQFELISDNAEPSTETQMKMALILIEQKNFKAAAGKLQEIVTKNSSADGARYYLAAVQEQNGDLALATENYLLVSTASEHFSKAVVHAAYLLKEAGKINQALEVTEKGLKNKSTLADIYVMHASLLDAKADYAGAANTLETGVAKNSQNAELRFQFALALDRVGKKTSMMNQMKEVLALDPHHVPSLSYLAFTMAELNQDLPQAEKLARRALEIDPNDAYVLDTLGWVLFKQKKFPESIQFLEKAHQNQATASIIAEHLADAYSMHAMTNKAKAMYDVAAGLTKDSARNKEIRSKIEKLM